MSEDWLSMKNTHQIKYARLNWCALFVKSQSSHISIY